MTSLFPWQIFPVCAATLGLVFADDYLPSHAQPPPIQAIKLADRNLLVTLDGAPGQAGWRLRGEKSWRSSGTLSPRLYQGAHWVEFRPVSGWNTPPAVLKESTDPGATPDATPTAIYTAKTSPQPSGSGFLRATPTPPVGGWRIIGSPTWIPSGDILPNLPPGPATIEFQPVTGYIAPPNQTLEAFPGQGAATRATYHPVPANSTWAFTPLSPDGTNTRHISKAPFCYLGKIDSRLGTFTGVAIAQYTVLTTLQAIYDFDKNEVIPDITWSWAHDSSFGINEPLTPAGFVFLENFNSDALRNPENQTVAVYFRTPVANGGHSGHHPYLEATRKALFAGYQVTAQNPIPVSTAEIPLPPLSISSTGLFSIQNLHLAEGLVGAPLLTRRSDNRWYPAAIHLGNGQFRRIDSSIETLIRVAEEAALRGKGGTFSDGSRVGSEFGLGSPRFGRIRTMIDNPASARWMLNGDMTLLASSEEAEVEVGDHVVNFVEVTNFTTPPSSDVIVLEGATVELRATYTSLEASWRDNAFTTAQLNAGIDIGPHDDFDGDGISNLLEWAFGFNPTGDLWQPATSAPPSMPAVTRQTSGDPPRLTIQFLRRKQANGVTYRAEFSSTLNGAWSTPGDDPANVTVSPVPGNDEWESVTVVDTVPMAEANSRFARVAVEEPAP